MAATEDDDATEDETGTETVARARWLDLLAMLRVNFHAWWEGYEADWPDTAEDDAGRTGRRVGPNPVSRWSRGCGDRVSVRPARNSIFWP